MKIEEKELDNVTDTIEWVCEQVCTHMCKYHGTETRDGECQLVRENGSCPLSKLY